MDTTYEKLRTYGSITPRLIATNTATNGTPVDLGVAGGGRNEAAVAILAGTITDGTYAVTVEESATGVGDWTALDEGQYQGEPPTVVAADDNKMFEFGVIDTKRYLRTVITSASTSSGGTIAAVIVVGNRRFTPVR